MTSSQKVTERGKVSQIKNYCQRFSLKKSNVELSIRYYYKFTNISVIFYRSFRILYVQYFSHCRSVQICMLSWLYFPNTMLKRMNRLCWQNEVMTNICMNYIGYLTTFIHYFPSLLIITTRSCISHSFPKTKRVQYHYFCIGHFNRCHFCVSDEKMLLWCSRTALIGARLFKIISSYSSLGSERAVMAPPAPTEASPSCMTTVRITILRSNAWL